MLPTDFKHPRGSGQRLAPWSITTAQPWLHHEPLILQEGGLAELPSWTSGSLAPCRVTNWREGQPARRRADGTQATPCTPTECCSGPHRPTPDQQRWRVPWEGAPEQSAPAGRAQTEPRQLGGACAESSGPGCPGTGNLPCLTPSSLLRSWEFPYLKIGSFSGRD